MRGSGEQSTQACDYYGRWPHLMCQHFEKLFFDDTQPLAVGAVYYHEESLEERKFGE